MGYRLIGPNGVREREFDMMGLQKMDSRPKAAWVKMREVFIWDFLKYLNQSEQPDQARSYGTFNSIVTRLLPSIDELSVEEILALRRHEYFASFRRKTSELMRIAASGADVGDVIEEQERDDIKTLQAPIFSSRAVGEQRGASVLRGRL